MRRVVLLAFMWGWSFLFIKVAVRDMTPFTLAFGRLALGAITLLIIGGASNVRLPRDGDFWRAVGVVGVIGTAIPFTLLAWGEQRISSGLTSVAQATTSLFTALFAAVLLSERLRPVQIIGLVTGLVGVGIAAGVGAGDLSASAIAGVVAAVAAGAAYGLSYSWQQRHLLGVPPLVAATGQLICGAAVLAPFAIVTSVISGFSPTPPAIGSLLLLGVVNTGIAYWLNYQAVAQVGATAASLVTYLVPLVAVLAGWLVLGESISVNLVVGMIVIVVSVVAVRRPARSATGVARAR